MDSVLSAGVIALFSAILIACVCWNRRVGSRAAGGAPRAPPCTSTPSATTRTAVGRPLGLLERWYKASHDSSLLHNVAFVIRCFVVNTNQLPTLESIQEAMYGVCANHPSLRVCLDRDELELDRTDRAAAAAAAPVFSSLPLLEFKQEFDSQFETRVREGEESWQRVCEREHERKFAVGGLLWRLLLVTHPQSPAFELVFVVHHAVADGVSGSVLCRELLEAHVRDESGRRRHMVSGLAGGLADAPPLDALVDLRPTFGAICKALVGKDLPFLRRFIEDAPDAFLGPPHDLAVPASERSAGICYVRLKKGPLSRLLSKCHLEGTTAHAALVSAASFASCYVALQSWGRGSALDALDDADFAFDVSADHAINLRRYAVPAMPDDCIGAFVCGARTEHSLRLTNSFWSEARSCKRQLVAEHKVRDSYSAVGLLNFLSGSWEDFCRSLGEKSPNGRSHTFAVSNLGRCHYLPNYGCWNLREVCFSHTKAKEGPLFNLSTMTSQGKLCTTIAYPTPTVSKEIAIAFADAFYRILLRAAGDDEPRLQVEGPHSISRDFSLREAILMLENDL